jgi:rod shape determining protein RodA
MATVDLPLPPTDRAPGGRLTTAEPTPLNHIDATLILAAAGLVLFGLLMVYSATHRSQALLGGDPSFFLKRQALFLVVGAVALAVSALVDYRLLRTYAPFIYLGTVFLLLLVRTPLGKTVLGAQRGFYIGPFQFTPSQFARLGLIVMLAAVLSEIKGDLWIRDVVRATVLAAVPMILVFVQPDIGTTIVLAAIMAAILIVSGAKARYLAVLGLAASLAIFGAFQLHVVKDYQVKRLVGFLDPKSDPQRAGYNRTQAEIAIGAGGLTGRGYLRGSQTNLAFVPEQHTDFIFTVVGEELGFVGAMLLLLLFGVMLWRAFRIALLSKDPLGTFLATGVAAMFAIQVFVNVGMTLGIMPITGIPLPFVSYGGSALIADLMGVGLLLNVHARRYV